MKLHDNISFEDKKDAGLPCFKGTAIIDIEAHGANESDVKMQLLQTLAKADTEELIEMRDEIEMDLQ